MRISVMQDCLHELKEGDKTQAEVSDDTGHDRELVRRALNRMVNEPRPRRAHIIRWTSAQPGERNYPRPVYRFGDGKNRTRPAPKDPATREREWLQRKHAKLKASSVFNLGVTQREVRRPKVHTAQDP